LFAEDHLMPASEDRPIDAPVWNMDRKIETAKQSLTYTTAYSIVLDVALDMLAKGVPVGEESLLAAATEHLGLQQTAHGDVLYWAVEALCSRLNG
jgi:hypothetical protein